MTSGLRRLAGAFRAILARRRVDEEVDAELQAFLDAAIDRKVAAGLDHDAAVRAARVEVGSLPAVRDRIRDVGWEAFVESLWQDVRFGARATRKHATLTAGVVFTLAIGLAAAATIFAIVHTVLLRPLPYPRPDRLVQVWERTAAGGRMIPSDPNFHDLRTGNRTLDGLAQYASDRVAAIVNGSPFLADAAYASADFFGVMGVQPALGRAFVDDERRFSAGPHAIVSHEFWRARLGARPEALGTTIQVMERPTAVIGVMPEGFRFPGGTEVWLSLEQWVEHPTGRTGRRAAAIGRVNGHATLAHAQQDLSGIAQRLKQQHGSDTSMTDAAVVPLREGIVGSVRPVLLALLGAVVFLLIVVCANVANLLLARATGRGREVALRLALGASRARVARQLVLETMVLVGGASAIALAITVWSVRLLRAAAPSGLPRMEELTFGWPIAGFVLAAAAMMSIVAGGLVARRAMGGGVRASLRQEPGATRGASSQRLRGTLVVVQIAITLVLLIGAGLLSRSVRRLLDVTPGFRTSDVLAITVYHPPIPGASLFDPPGAADADRRRRVRALDEMASRLRALPFAAQVGLVDALPLSGRNASGAFGILHTDAEVAQLESDMRDGRLDRIVEMFNDPARTGYAGYRSASRGYFEAIGIPLLRGRLFEEADTLDAPHVAVISDTLARARWPDRDPIGQRIEFGNMDGDLRPLTIVGVVGDVRDAGLDQPPRPIIYTCYAQRPDGAFSLVVRGREGIAPSAAALESAVRAVAPDVPTRVVSIEALLGSWLEWRRVVLLVLGLFGATALALALTGVYAALSYAVSQQTREIGIRLALGEQPRAVQVMVLRRAAVLTLAGVGLGGLGALASARLLGSLLYEVTSNDPMTYLATSLLLLLVAVLASWLPARRAATVDILRALRAD